MAKVSQSEFEPIESRVPESLMRRLILDAATSKYGTQAGKMRLRKQLTDAQFSACKWFDELNARYQVALCSPGGIKTSTGERVSKGNPPDPFSPLGWDIAEDEHLLVRRFDAARKAAMEGGLTQFKLFWFVVIEDGIPTGYACPLAVAKVADLIEAYRSRDSKRKGKRR